MGIDLKRILRHLFTPGWRLRRLFPAAALAAVEAAVRQAEQSHDGQIAVAMEAALPFDALLRGQTAGQRALEVFAHMRVWDTEQNNGVLIYLLLADRDVEIIADRGIHAKAGAESWEAICRQMEQAFRQSDFQGGMIAGIGAVGGHLTRHFPGGGGRNELPDRPVLM